MGSSKHLMALMLISLLCLISVAFAEDASDVRRAKLERTLGKPQSPIEGAASSDEITFPEDTSPRFSAKKLQISGNNLISTTELLEKLPFEYIISTQKDDKPVKELYDFRTLHDLIGDPEGDHEVSLKTIQGLTKYILSVYQEKGYAGIYVYVPAEAVKEKEKLEDEILPIQVIEGKIAQISIARYDFDRQSKENGFLKSSVIESWSPIREGNVIQKNKLDYYVRLLNLNPDRFVSPVISRSTEPNALNLSYDVYETNPWHLYVQADNSGTRDRQWSPRVGLINTNLTGVDDRFSVMYQAPWEKGIEEEYAVFGNYNFPVFTPRLRLNLYSGYSQFDIQASGINFLGNGSFYGSILSYNLLQINSWFLDLTGSLSNERSKVTPSLGIASDVDMELWGMGINIHRSDELSNSSVTFNRSQSMGGSSKKTFEEARVDANPDFTIFRFAAVHSRYLDSNKVNRISGSFRLTNANERLVPAKMTTFGGLYSVRGYEEDEIVADEGILISGQYEFDLVKAGQTGQNSQDSEGKQQDKEPLLKKVAPLFFYDLGRAKIKEPVAGEQSISELCSIGTGIIIEAADDFSAGIYCGWALRGTDETERGHARLNASFMKRF
jgi:hemolysin activation/secretion protein